MKKRVWEIIEVAKNDDIISRIFDTFILSLIFLNIFAVIIGTIKDVQVTYGIALYYFEVFSIVVFTVEYLLRVWSCTIDSKFSKSIKGRLKFVKQPLLLIDLFSIVPFYIPFIGVDFRIIRIFRLLRILRVIKIGRYYSELQIIKNVFKSKKEELVLTFSIMFMLLIISASLMYCCENAYQPNVFTSIPATMWWSVMTFTTVGYGDVYPITILGKFIASIIAILGIGMFALPTGILGTGFVEEIQKRKETNICPHCNKKIEYSEGDGV